MHLYCLCLYCPSVCVVSLSVLLLEIYSLRKREGPLANVIPALDSEVHVKTAESGFQSANIVVYFVLNNLRWDVVLCCVAICWIVDNSCLKFFSRRKDCEDTKGVIGRHKSVMNRYYNVQKAKRSTIYCHKTKNTST